ncbi:MAG: DNA-binding response regulator [Meiothermus sp.]
MTRVFIIEDHAFTRDGLRVAVSREPDLKVVGEARSAEEGLERLEHTPADVVLMDIGLPGMDGIEATRRVKERFGVRVVVLTVHQLEAEVLAAIASGADAYCLKSTDPASLLLALRAAAMGSIYLDPQIAHIVLGRLNVPGEAQAELTKRELEILRLIAEGRSNRQIAQDLGISLSTVKTHVEELLAKLSASDRTQAAIRALRQGLL